MSKKIEEMTMQELETRQAEIVTESETATGDALAELEKEANAIVERKKQLKAAETRAAIRKAVANGAGEAVENPLAGNDPDPNETRAKALAETRHEIFSTKETRAVLVSSGNLATPTATSGINDSVGAKVSSIIDMVRIVNCEGMGSNKIAYSRRRKYLLGRETHGLMNYPFRTALLAWLGGGDAADFRRGMETIRENYPPAAFYGAMNFLGTHDTARILTLLGAEDIPADKPERAAYRLSPAALARGQRKLRLAGMLLYSFPGSPTLFYGDEAGMQGFEDPLNRGTFPWGGEDAALTAFFQTLGDLRQRESLRRGRLAYIRTEGGCLVIERAADGERTVTALNAGDAPVELVLPWDAPTARDGVTGQRFLTEDGVLRVTLPPLDGMILV